MTDLIDSPGWYLLRCGGKMEVVWIALDGATWAKDSMVMWNQDGKCRGAVRNSDAFDIIAKLPANHDEPTDEQLQDMRQAYLMMLHSKPNVTIEEILRAVSKAAKLTRVEAQPPTRKLSLIELAALNDAYENSVEAVPDPRDARIAELESELAAVKAKAEQGPWMVAMTGLVTNFAAFDKALEYAKNASPGTPRTVWQRVTSFVAETTVREVKE